MSAGLAQKIGAQFLCPLEASIPVPCDLIRIFYKFKNEFEMRNI
jgi:hypothetical protein